MGGVLESVNQRTQLVGQNRLELLLFRLEGDQLYGINVFKVKEVLQCPPLTVVPQSNPFVRGVAHIRGSTVPIIDLNSAIGRGPASDLDQHFVIITEYNLRVQGFLVAAVERIVNMNWGDIHPPPRGVGHGNYLTAVTDLDGKLVEIIDVEKILAEVSPGSQHISEGLLSAGMLERHGTKHIIVVDDSSIARKQIVRCIKELGCEATTFNDGRQAYDYLTQMAAECDSPLSERFLMVISDIEMPEMDGYTLTAEIRANPNLQDLYVLLHTSLSGVFNNAMVKKVGANAFIAKFQPDVLAEAVVERIQSGPDEPVNAVA
ncbi:MAG: chemotaxis protein CheV [Pseudomonadota bacterium]|nr:chemotaxis protein CheV [Pseudomonadota bacterium]